MLTWPLPKRNWTVRRLYILDWSPSILWMSSSKVSLILCLSRRRTPTYFFIKTLNRLLCFIFPGLTKIRMHQKKILKPPQQRANNSSIKAFNLFSHSLSSVSSSQSPSSQIANLKATEKHRKKLAEVEAQLVLASPTLVFQVSRDFYWPYCLVIRALNWSTLLLLPQSFISSQFPNAGF